MNVSSRLNAAALLFVTAGFGSQVAYAHHSQAMFEMSQCKMLAGTVRTLEFQYPHSWLWVVVQNKSGNADIWAFEFAAPGNLVAIDPRWNENVVKKGDKVSVEFSPIKDGRKAGSMASLTAPDGNKLTIGTPACAGKYSHAASVLRELNQPGGQKPE